MPRATPSPIEGLAGFRRLIRQQDPENLEFPVEFLRTGAWLTPIELFYVRSHFPYPSLDRGSWRLAIEGEVERPLHLTWNDLQPMLTGARRSLVVTLECAGNRRTEFDPSPPGVPWQLGAVSTAEWSGAPLAELLRLARPRAGAREVILEGADRGPREGREGDVPFARSIPIEKALHPDTLLADRMNGAPLLPAHGYPLRALVPGWYGMDSVKWLTRLRVTAEPFAGAFQADDYQLLYPQEPDRGPVALHAIGIQSIIAAPARRERLPVDEVRICGAAWAGENQIGRVEVSTDGGRRWSPAELGPDASAYAWRLWEYRWRPAAPGAYELAARAVDSRGQRQPDEVPWNARGYARNSIHRVPVRVLTDG